MAQTSISLDSWSMNASNRLATACLQGVTPTLGPISTGLGEIYLWTVEAEDGAKKADGTPYTPMDLREIQDWVIKPQLRMPGVTEINSIGGFAKEYLVSPRPEQLAAYGFTLADLGDGFGAQQHQRRCGLH
jgi:Cu/Ag efflux pump CusA